MFISGIRPSPGSWKKWSLERLEPKAHKTTDAEKKMNTNNVANIDTQATTGMLQQLTCYKGNFVYIYGVGGGIQQVPGDPCSS